MAKIKYTPFSLEYAVVNNKFYFNEKMCNKILLGNRKKLFQIKYNVILYLFETSFQMH